MKLYIILLSFAFLQSALSGLYLSDDVEDDYIGDSSNMTDVYKRQTDECAARAGTKVAEAISITGDVVTSIASMDVFKNGVQVLAKLSSIGSALGPAMGILGGLLGSLFPTSNKDCELHAKVDQVLNKLDYVLQGQKEIIQVVECSAVKSKYLILYENIEYLFKSLSIWQYRKDLNSRRTHFQYCGDPTQGILRQISLFENLLDEGNMREILSNCARFRTNEINEWFKRLMDLAVGIVSLARSCEEAGGGNTTFDYDLFTRQVAQNLKYYSQVYVRQQFLFKGLDSLVNNALTRGASARSIEQELNSKHSFLQWTAIGVKSEFGSAYRYLQFTLPHCGAKYILGKDWNIMVMWNMAGSTIDIRSTNGFNAAYYDCKKDVPAWDGMGWGWGYYFNPADACNAFNDPRSTTPFAFILSIKNYIGQGIQLPTKEFCSTIPDHKNYIKYAASAKCNGCSVMSYCPSDAWRLYRANSATSVEFTKSNGVILPNEMTETPTKIAERKENVRLGNENILKSWSAVETEATCWLQCQAFSNCVAITYSPKDKYCYLYKSNYKRMDRDFNGWISYFKLI